MRGHAKNVPPKLKSGSEPLSPKTNSGSEPELGIAYADENSGSDPEFVFEIGL